MAMEYSEIPMGASSTMDRQDEPNLLESMEALEKHRIECERSGKYEEAELAKTRLAQLRQQEENRRCDELRSQQVAKRLGVEEAHMRELQEFNDIWDQKVIEYEDHAGKLQSTLAARQKQEHEQYLEKLRKEVGPCDEEGFAVRASVSSLSPKRQVREALRSSRIFLMETCCCFTFWFVRCVYFLASLVFYHAVAFCQTRKCALLDSDSDRFGVVFRWSHDRLGGAAIS